jgi:lipopolysaccharide transport system ATP-binding protein
MSGRENVFMSGTLLGISKAEIRAKFDELVAFADIEDFIDMPVKRYSSGMYVRLAYAVASILRSDILILDEVLAVGDMGFQEKARKNMKEITNSGRTILFVSHYAQGISQLCNRGIILNHGKLTHEGAIADTVTAYRRQFQNIDYLSEEISAQADLRDMPRLEHARKKIIQRVELVDEYGLPCALFKTGGFFCVQIHYTGADMPVPTFYLLIANEFGERVSTISSAHIEQHLDFPKSGIVQCVVGDVRLGEGVYFLCIEAGNSTASTYLSIDSLAALKFGVQLDGYLSGLGVNSTQGAVHKSQWRILT